MLGDSNEEVRRLVVNKVNFLRERSLDYHIPNEDFVRGYLLKDAGNGDHKTFCVPKINLTLKYRTCWCNLNVQDEIQPLAVRSCTDAEIRITFCN